MNSAKAQSALKEYGKVSVQTGASYASPHRLILMLLDGALEKISSAKGFMQRGEIANKGNYISWAISIVEGLRLSLDLNQGGEIADNL
ncbi:MAG: flagellar export chaperone FliS, partial [Gammaproteobacteria bacterium]|nr:flagellar export chaperone FliS [Gammaproteobacteria bacterium]